MKEKMPLAKVAEKLETTPLNVLMHVKKGMLQGTEEEGGWMIDKASFEALVAKTGGSKADVVCARGCSGKHACSDGCG